MIEKLNRWRKARPGLFLIAACYFCAAVLWLGGCIGLFAANRLLYAGGALAPAELTAADFEWEGIAGDGERLWTTDADPQLILKDGARLVENVTLEIDYERPPRSRTAYWKKAGEDYALARMAYSHRGQGRVFYLPAAGVRGLRFDPDTLPGTEFTLKYAAVNLPRPLWAFFAPGAPLLAALLAGPGLTAAALSVALQAARRARLWPKRRAGVRKAGEALF